MRKDVSAEYANLKNGVYVLSPANLGNLLNVKAI
jgi:hypothetical protein